MARGGRRPKPSRDKRSAYQRWVEVDPMYAVAVVSLILFQLIIGALALLIAGAVG